MKIAYIFINFFLTVLLAITVFQIIPTLVSANDWFKVSAGVGLVLLSAAFIWARGVEIYNDLKNKE